MKFKASDLPPGQEHIAYIGRDHPERKPLYFYAYRTFSGKCFYTVKNSPAQARRACANWLLQRKAPTKNPGQPAPIS